MCIPHGTTSLKSNGYEKKVTRKKHIIPMSNEEFESGNPDFVDERIIPYKTKKKKSFFESLFSE